MHGTLLTYAADRRATEAAIANTTAALAAAATKLREAKRALESNPADEKLLTAAAEAESAHTRASLQHEATRTRSNSFREVWLRDHAHEVEAELEAELEALSAGSAYAALRPIVERVAGALRVLDEALGELRQLEQRRAETRTRSAGLSQLLGRPVTQGEHFDLARLVLAVNIAARTCAGLARADVAGDGASFGDDAAHLAVDWPRFREVGRAVETRLARLARPLQGVEAAAFNDAAMIGGAS